MADSTLSGIHYAERFRWFASEYLEIRRSKGNLLDHAYLTDDLVQLIHDAFKSRLLPCELQNRAESSGVGSAGMLGVRLIGYQSFVDVTQPDENFVDDPTRVLELRPGWMGELWPQFFPALMYLSSRPDEPYGEMIVKAKKDRFFVYVGAFAKLCELIAENIEREMATIQAPQQADNKADDGNQTKTALSEAALKAVIDGGLASVMSQAIGVRAKQRHSETIVSMLKSDARYYEWSLDEWASYLGAAKKTIRDTEAWRRIMEYREQNKQDRAVE
jgi:hypothetical protein